MKLQCTNPYTVVPKTWYLQGKPVVPLAKGFETRCFKCHACRKWRAFQWGMRIEHEQDYFIKKGLFITLTYDNEHLPENYSLNKKDLQNFIKRLRYYLPKEQKIKYYACGEYGDQKQRPHYHLIILGVNNCEEDLEAVNKSWTMGIIHTGNVTYGSATYVAQYTAKKIIGEKAKEYYEQYNRIAPFQLQSQGMGLRWALENQEQIKDLLYIPMDNNYKSDIPKYYRIKLGITQEDYIKKLGQEKILKEKEIKVLKYLMRGGINVFDTKKMDNKIQFHKLDELLPTMLIDAELEKIYLEEKWKEERQKDKNNTYMLSLKIRKDL